LRRPVLLLAAIVMMTMGLSPQAALASGTTVVIGGGTGTFDADLDGDEDTDGSFFGIGVTIQENGAAEGYFVCLMTGRFDFLDLPLMLVEGTVTSGMVHDDGSAVFGGTGTVDLGNGQLFTDVPFEVKVTAGGPEVGALTLTVFGAFDGTPGDTLPGNGNYELPEETVSEGLIEIHQRG
jgi:hypothetical protein